MNRIIEDYLRQVETSLRASPDQKRLIVIELKGHLQEKLADLKRERPDAADDDLAREVLADLGNPRELALAYTPEGTPVLKTGTGETVLRVGKAVGRGAGKFLKWFAIALACMVVLAIGVGIWAFYEFRPYFEKNIPYTVFDHADLCLDRTCNLTSATETFFVHGEAREVRMELSIDHARGSNGTLQLLVLDPEGGERYNRTFAAAASGDTHLHTTWVGVGGNWTVQYGLQNFRGSFDVEVMAVGLPKEGIA